MSFFDKPIVKGIGWVATVIALLWFVYDKYFENKYPEYTYEVLSKISLFDNIDDVNKINVYIDSIDIKESRFNISVFTLRVSNDGAKVITSNSYDEGTFGLSIKNGTIIEAIKIINASTDHIKARFDSNIKSTDSTLISFPKITIEPKEYYTVKFSILHNRETTPSFLPKGKIIEQNSIEVIHRSTEDKEDINIWRGDWWIQIVRIISYSIIFFMILIAIIGISSSSSDYLAKRKRKKFIKINISKHKLDETVKNEYIEKGEWRIDQIYNYIQSADGLLTQQYKKSNGYINSQNINDAKNIRHKRFHSNRIEEFNNYKRDGFISIDDEGNIIVNKAKRNSVKYLHKILKERGILEDEIPDYDDYVVGRNENRNNNIVVGK